MKKIIGFLLLFWAPIIYAQSTFSLIIDIDTTNQDSNTGNTIVADEDGILIGTLDFCDNGTCTDFVKTDLNGNIEWINTPDNYTNVKTSIGNLIRTIEGNYTTFGTIELPGGGAICGILNLNEVGEDISWLQFCNDAYGVGWHSLHQLPDSSFLATYAIGNPFDPNTTERFMVNIAKNGDILDSIDIDYEFYGNVATYDTCQNGYFMGERIWTEFVNGAPQYSIIRRTDAQGVPLWSHELNVIDSGYPAVLVKTMQDGNVVACWSMDTVLEDDNHHRAWHPTVQCFDGETGTLLWQTIIPGGPEEKYLATIRIARNGDIIGCGEYHDRELDGGYGGGWLFRMSPQGQLLWDRHFYYPVLSQSYSLIDLVETPDGGIASTGWVFHQNPNNQWESDAWLLKVDANGCLTPNCTDYGIILGGVDTPPGTLAPAPPQIHISPNPAHSEARVFFPAPLPQKGFLELHNASGDLVKTVPVEAGARRLVFSVGELPNGIYVVALQDAHKHIVSSAQLLVVH